MSCGSVNKHHWSVGAAAGHCSDWDVCVRVSLDVVAERPGTVDAAVRPSKLMTLGVGLGGVSPGGRAIVKILHQYHQFTVREVRQRLGLVLLGAADVGGGCGAAELV